MKKTRQVRKLMKSAKIGNGIAMYRLGICYQLGKGIKQDMQLATEWIYLSAELGYERAKEWIKDYSFDDDAFVQANV